MEVHACIYLQNLTFLAQRRIPLIAFSCVMIKINQLYLSLNKLKLQIYRFIYHYMDHIVNIVHTTHGPWAMVYCPYNMVHLIWIIKYGQKNMVNGSPNLSHFIFETNVGKRRIRHRTTLNLNTVRFNQLRVDRDMIIQNPESFYEGSDSFRH